MTHAHATILTEAGPGVGLGHLRRSEALAHALRARGATVDLDVASRTSGWTCDLDAARRRLGARGADVVTVDSYAATPEFLARLRGVARCVVAVDDLADRRLDVHVVVNGACHAPRLPYRGSVDTVWLLGPRYLLLAPVFASVAPAPVRDAVERVLVTLGGDPAADELRVTVETVRRAIPRAVVDVVVGEASRGVMDTHEKIRVHRAPRGLHDLLLAADLVVSGGGVTLYEALAAGTPIVGRCLAENQRGNIEELARAGLLVRGDGALDVAVETLACDADLRRSMRARGREVVDGQGASRVADVVLRVAADARLTEAG